MANTSMKKPVQLPASLRPLIRAYVLGYITVTGPRLFGFLRVLSRRGVSLSAKLNLLYTIIRTSAEPNRFPTACAIVVGGATALPRLIQTILRWLLQQVAPNRAGSLSPRLMTRLRFVTSFCSAYLAFNLLNKDPAWSRKRAKSISLNTSLKPSQAHDFHPFSATLPASTQLAGKTIDCTLFAFTRALDAVAITLWQSTRSSVRHPSRTHPRASHALVRLADPTIFAFSAAAIMHAWFYRPSRLPKTYQHWISTAAAIDPHLIEILRRARNGEMVYGVDTGQADLLVPLCRELGLPRHWADPKITVPIPCELYHSGTGPSCEYHALVRFVRSFLFAARLYLPLNLLSSFFQWQRLRRASSSSSSSSSSLRDYSHILVALLKSTSRSASFLAAFVASFYYAVCLARTRLGPKLFPKTLITPQMWDNGLCVLAGCLVCGWSVLVETRSKRQELAFFVAPRALGTLLPRVYDREKFQARERWVFALSVASVLTVAVGDTSATGRGKGRGGQRIRGVFGRVLDGVLKDA